MDQQLITRIVEAALLAASQPLTLPQLHGLVHGDNLPLDEPAPEGSVERALETLQAQSAERGVELVEVASGWRYQVQADVHPWVARLWNERQTKYTRATLETLALIAYRQPITRGEIEQIRGVAVNSNIIKALEEREWIRVVGHRDMPGKPELLGTTKGFLDYFGLKRLDELPPLSELKDFGDLDPQLQFDAGPIVVDNISDLGNEGKTPADTDTDTSTENDADVDADIDAETSVQEDAPAEDMQADDASGKSAGDSDESPEDELPEHDSPREERADSDPKIAGRKATVDDTENLADADADADADFEDAGPDDAELEAADNADDSTHPNPDQQTKTALAEEGDSNGAKHE